MRQINALLLLAIVALLSACRHQVPDNPANVGSNDTDNGSGTGNTNPCDSNKIYFRQQVLPILISNCAMSGCHDNTTHAEGVILTSYQSVMNTAGIQSGRPLDSELYERIIDTDPSDRMPQPPKNPLTAQQTGLIRRWIEQGAQDLVCQDMCDSSSFTYTISIKTIITNKCQGCHSGASAQGGIDLSTYNGLKAKITDGRLWGAVNHTTGFSPMPKNGTKLSVCELAQIRKWIDAGALNN